jgi:heme/copper-type cytochrome/quinol oxidase subunit 3
VSTSSSSAHAAQDEHIPANFRVGSRLLASALVFIFVSFVFAFFYLRALNSNNDFRPPHSNPIQGLGIAVLLCVIATAGLLEFARRYVSTGAETHWRNGALGALALGLLVVVFQVLEFTSLEFTTTHGGYASVFWGWTIVYLLFWLGGLYWLETLIAQSLRAPVPPDGGVSLLRSGADGCVIYLWTMVGIEVVTWILLYLVK